MSKDLRKDLNLLDIFCVATGAMISSGLFILPALAFIKAGPAVILSYLLAGILCIPSVLSKAELTTAMPKAGGDYFYIMRGFGPLLGTLAGFSSWFSLSLKGAFALVGMGAYLSIITHLPLTIVALLCCLLFMVVNLLGIGEAGKLQIALVVGLLFILFLYVVLGMQRINVSHFSPFFSQGLSSVLATTSFVFISFGGLTKVAALAEETKNPGRNLPLGMFLSLLVTSIVYGLVIFVTVGVLNPDVLSTTWIPISEGAGVIGGPIFRALISIGAFLAFISTANAGIMTASRYPLSMSRDRLLLPIFQKVSHRFKTPYIAILFTGCFMIVFLFLPLELLVKIASSILILLFMFANLSIILFRESKIQSYRPKFRAPFYPSLQTIGIFSGFFLLIEMGTFVVFLTLLFLFLGFVWYRVYVQKRVSRDSALIYALERLISKDREFASDSLLTELKDIVVQRDRVVEDTFHRLIEESICIDIERPCRVEDFFVEITGIMGHELKINPQMLCQKFIEREKEATTVIRKGLAIPHIVVEGNNIIKIVIVRAKAGIIFFDDQSAHIIFVIVGSPDKRNLHLKVLAAIAQITQNPSFDEMWMEAKNQQELRNLILLAKRKRG